MLLRLRPHPVRDQVAPRIALHGLIGSDSAITTCVGRMLARDIHQNNLRTAALGTHDGRARLEWVLVELLREHRLLFRRIHTPNASAQGPRSRRDDRDEPGAGQSRAWPLRKRRRNPMARRLAGRAENKSSFASTVKMYQLRSRALARPYDICITPATPPPQRVITMSQLPVTNVTSDCDGYHGRQDHRLGY